MAVKEKWKNFGKSTVKAFANFGKAMKTTAKVALGKEEELDENGNSKLKEAWSKTGKGFGNAGVNLGKAAKGTIDAIDKVESEEEVENKERQTNGEN